MTFNSYIFILLFLPISLIGYFLLNRITKLPVGKVFLLGMSLWFYGYFNYWYLPIIGISILFNFGLGRLFLRESLKGTARKWLLFGGVLANVGLLFYYKYYDFFIGNLNALFQTDFSLIHVMLPLGISFFTFQQIAYIVDSYRGTTSRYAILDYALFVSFFPHLVNGPIVLHSEMIPQYENPALRRFNMDNFAKGITAFSRGLAKKVLIADVFGAAVNWGYANVAQLDTTNAVLVMLAYTFQIYFDFSGYCDMATGIGLMFNIRIAQNFNSPYKALTIADFWKRWHITLTRFFTTYIYIPLGGNRRGKWRTYLNMFIVFFVSGIWHGANWTFILWGALHGLAVVINRMFKEKINHVHPALSWMLTFGFVNVAWIYFRAPTVGTANQIVRSIFKLEFGPIADGIRSAFVLPEFTLVRRLLHIQWPWFETFLMGAAFLLAFWLILGWKNTNEKLENFRPGVGVAVSNAVLLTWAILSFSGVSTFLYFNF